MKLQYDNFTLKDDELYLKDEFLAKFVPDKKYPTMFRIKYADGKVSDMFNKGRAKDSAIKYYQYIMNQAIEMAGVNP